MYRGTTPTLTFNLPMAVSTLSEYWVTVSQHYDNIRIDRDKTTLTASGSSIVANLTQEETLRLVPDKPVFIQLRVLTSGGDAKASEIFKTMVNDALREEVIA
jgi:hypothetical protein